MTQPTGSAATAPAPVASPTAQNAAAATPSPLPVQATATPKPRDTPRELRRLTTLVIVAGLVFGVTGLATFLLGIAIAFSDLVQPGGHKLIGGLLAVMGALDAVIAPRILKKGWERQDQ